MRRMRPVFYRRFFCFHFISIVRIALKVSWSFYSSLYPSKNIWLLSQLCTDYIHLYLKKEKHWIIVPLLFRSGLGIIFSMWIIYHFQKIYHVDPYPAWLIDNIKRRFLRPDHPLWSNVAWGLQTSILGSLVQCPFHLFTFSGSGMHHSAFFFRLSGSLDFQNLPLTCWQPFPCLIRRGTTISLCRFFYLFPVLELLKNFLLRLKNLFLGFYAFAF